MEDILGLKVWGETAKLFVGSGLDGVKGFLNALAKPAIDELGFMFKDRITERRLKNIIAVLTKGQGQFKFEDGELKINPKLLGSIIEGASNEDEDDMQELWAGLLAASCNNFQTENSIYVDLLKKTSPLRAKMLNHGCQFSKKVSLKEGNLSFGPVDIKQNDLLGYFGTDDLNRLWIEIEYMVTLGLQFVPTTFDGGLYKYQDKLVIYPSDLAMEFYIRCHGSALQAKEFFKKEIISS